MSIANFLSLILRQEMKVGIRVRVLLTTFFKIKYYYLHVLKRLLLILF
jgi:hypothetical protein